VSDGLPRTLFGTDGIRGVANVYPMTPEVAMRLGQAMAVQLRAQGPLPRFIIGKDTRRSGYMLETALTAGMTSMGAEVYLLGPLPTPAVAYHIRGMRAQGGVMISASHNPYEDNGLKVFQDDGYKLSDQAERDLEALILDPASLEKKLARPKAVGKAQRIDDALGRYLASLKTIFKKDFNLKGLKIVFDGANGAAYDCGPKLLEELGAEVICQACEPDGININRDCAQENVRLLADRVLAESADLGIGVDGDADRLLLVDETGRSLSGEHFLFEMAVYLKKMGRLKANALVTTSMTNQALEDRLKATGIRCYRAEVGDRYVTAMLKDKGAIFGGETSGHYIFLDQNTAADALFSALEVLALLRHRGCRASDLQNAFELFPQKLVSVAVKQKTPLEQVPRLKAAIEQVEKHYQGKGRVNVRYSGTQSMLRLMVEGPDLVQVETDINALTEIVQAELGK